MEKSSKFQENQNPSPNSHGTNSTSSSTSSNGLSHHQPPPPPPPPTTPKPITRSEPNNPYPTTFVQADTSSFKQVVQLLTGSSDTAKHAAAAANRPEPPRNSIPPIKTGPKKQPSSKLYERRNSLRHFKISPLVPGLVHTSGFSPRKPSLPEILSPSILDFPSLVLSPVTPLIPDPFNRSPLSTPASVGSLDMEAENQAIAKKSFYLHPSPASTPRESEPRLLPLFPVTSPRVSDN